MDTVPESLAFPLRNKIIVITGANVGIGKSTAKLLAAIGGHIIMGCRSLERANEAIEDIKLELKKIQVDFEPSIESLELDLSDLESVKRFSSALHEKVDHIDVLINNAGVTTSQYDVTRQGFEMMFGVNHMGHFYLTYHVLDLLQASPHTSRIVIVASDAHRFSSEFQSKLNKEKEIGEKYSLRESMIIYGLTKGCNMMFSYRLNQYLNEKGIKNVTVNCLHPGAVDSSLQRNAPKWLSFLLKPIFYFFFKSTDQGSVASVKLASSDELEGVSGKYFNDQGNEDEPKSYITEEENMNWLWNYSKQLIRETMEEVVYE